MHGPSEEPVICLKEQAHRQNSIDIVHEYNSNIKLLTTEPFGR